MFRESPPSHKLREEIASLDATTVVGTLLVLVGAIAAVAGFALFSLGLMGLAGVGAGIGVLLLGTSR
jgi:hypothetical protein